MGEPLTTGRLTERYGAPAWLIRRIVDALKPPVPRVGLYRLIPPDVLPAVEAELRRRGYLRDRQAQTAQSAV
jgi:hypothetical protein